MKLPKFRPDKAWWRNMSGNFVGALLGIAVTFGTSALIQRHADKKLARKALINTIANIDRNLQSIDKECDKLLRNDTILRTVADRYPETERISRDTLNMFLSIFSDASFFALDDSPERIFTNSIETWETIDNPALQQSIGDCFAGKNMFFNIHNDLIGQQQEIFRKFCRQKYIYDHKNGAEAANAMLNMPEARNFVISHTAYANMLDRLLKLLAEINEQNKRIAGITDEEIDRTFDWETTDIETPAETRSEPK